MTAIKRDFVGDKNPNFKNAGEKICTYCGNKYHSYNKTRKYCSHDCYVKDQKEKIAESGLKGAHAPKRQREKLGNKRICKFCSVSFRCFTNQIYCQDHKDEAQQAKVSKIKLGQKKNPDNHIIANCLHCKKEFDFFKSRKVPQKYCSYDCYLNSGGSWRAGMAAAKATMKYGAKKDANHNVIVDALKKHGASVIDMSHVGQGFPDLIVGFASKTFLVEIKNPKTSYGKKGLNKNQAKWKSLWTGGAYCVVDSEEAAIRAISVGDEAGGTLARIDSPDSALRMIGVKNASATD